MEEEITGNSKKSPHNDIPYINVQVSKDESEIGVLSQSFVQDEEEEMKKPHSASISTNEEENHASLASVLDVEVQALQTDDEKSQQSDLPSLADSSEGTDEICSDCDSKSVRSKSEDKNDTSDDAIKSSFEPFLGDQTESKVEAIPTLSLKDHSDIGSSLETTQTSNVWEMTQTSKTEVAHTSESTNTSESVKSVNASETDRTSDDSVHVDDEISHTTESTCRTDESTNTSKSSDECELIKNSKGAQSPNDIISPVGAKQYDCGTACMLCVQDFLGCSNMGNSMFESKEDSVKREEMDAIETEEIDKMRKNIEDDLLTFMGCTGEGTNIWMNNLSQTCEQWNCFAASDDQPEDPFDLLKEYEKTNENSRKVQNRNVYIRDKAARRIRHLRSGGLSRSFTLAPVNDFLTKEFEDSSLDGKTIFSNSLGKPIPITCTKSAEYSWEHKSSRVNKGYTFKDVGGEKRFGMRFLMNMFGPQSINSVSSDVSESSKTDLYYDSDPEHDQEEIDSSEMRKTLLPMRDNPELRDASRDEVVVVEEREKVGEEFLRLEGHDGGEERDVQLEEDSRTIGHKTRQRSLLETFDVESTDMNDGALVTTLIKVYCTFLFLLLHNCGRVNILLKLCFLFEHKRSFSTAEICVSYGIRKVQ